ncbi:GNAT family N-acetyltransferase [Gallaecimonas sp. GXIMD4217]|uniref:GNAT family N-acetyltransferase n=1 Tax=Gallaecimonas sp. GXIMD4217 TaxID=3131927 RepID=UPI00311B1DC0
MPIDFQPSLAGTRVRLRPLQRADWQPLQAIAADPQLWEQHPNPSLYQQDEFRKYFDKAMASGCALAILDAETGQLIGTSRYYGFDYDRAEVCIGYTFFARSHWGGGYNGEAKRLMIDHALSKLDAVWFHIAKSNIRSGKAIEKVGAVLDHEGSKHSYGKEMAYGFYKISRARWAEVG